MFRQFGFSAATALGVLGVSAALAFSPAVSAQPAANPVTQIEVAASSVSLQQAVAQVKKQYGGRVLKAEPVSIKGKAGYRIRMMNDGRIREFLVDASSGQLMSP
ncbi:PepSY domain-containing protein [Pontibacterium granulatum]|uniref:PepSY domain-containing protein n=1 Tax=Pontibacterium granulatum TaxID=2036029 RepID=UPI00249C6059|nr:PepSY domain-containing protein [Pontibacterium granulatum]MDI3324610.1 PepSY domain-containing protein [Pontibacterium granulatum]